MLIVVVCEGCESATLDLISKARLIDPQSHITALCEGDCTYSDDCGSAGADEIVCVEYCDDDCAQAERLAAAIEALSPDVVLLPASIRGRFLSAWIAAKLQTGLTADCTDLQVSEDGRLIQIRPAFSGNIIAEIVCEYRKPQMASVRPGVFTLPPHHSTTAPIPVSKLHTVVPKQMLHKKSFLPNASSLSLQSERIIVAGGKGIGSAKGFAKLEKLADLLGGAVGASRGAVDAGWISYNHQIGQTGITVHPDLYIAVGIHGAIQHIMGMRSSTTVIAINDDHNAPIFSYANYGIVGDWEKTVDEIIHMLNNQR